MGPVILAFSPLVMVTRIEETPSSGWAHYLGGRPWALVPLCCAMADTDRAETPSMHLECYYL